MGDKEKLHSEDEHKWKNKKHTQCSLLYSANEIAL